MLRTLKPLEFEYVPLAEAAAIHHGVPLVEVRELSGEEALTQWKAAEETLRSQHADDFPDTQPAEL